MLRNKSTYEEAFKRSQNPPKFKAPDRAAKHKLEEKIAKHEVTTKNVNHMIAELPEKVKKMRASVKLRNDFLESQKRGNYINEYERLTGLMASSTTPALQQLKIRQRGKELEQLARASVEPKPYRMYRA